MKNIKLIMLLVTFLGISNCLYAQKIVGQKEKYTGDPITVDEKDNKHYFSYDGKLAGYYTKTKYDENTKKDLLLYQFDRVSDEFTTPIEVKQGNDVFYILPTTKVQSLVLPNSSKVRLHVNTKHSYIQDYFKISINYP